jgi:hypothetical protein
MLSNLIVDAAKLCLLSKVLFPVVIKCRFSLILSKTIKLDLDFMKIQVVTIDDEPCKVNICSRMLFLVSGYVIFFGGIL